MLFTTTLFRRFKQVMEILAVFILQTNVASGRTRVKVFCVPANVSLDPSRLKTGIRRIMRREALYALMRLQRRTKAFTASMWTYNAS